MKKSGLLFIFFTVALQGMAQADYSGVYGYPAGPAPDSVIAQGEKGRTVSLVLLRMNGSTYRFWLDINKGGPSYASGLTDGTLTFKNDTASFDNTFEMAKRSCVLHFRITNNVISLKADSHSADCGFGNGVVADGEYPRLPNQPLPNNNWLKEQYSQSPVATVITEKAELYEDEDGFRKKPFQFKKGDTMLSIAEGKQTFYTEYITPEGKFVFGWLKKSTVKTFAE